MVVKWHGKRFYMVTIDYTIVVRCADASRFKRKKHHWSVLLFRMNCISVENVIWLVSIFNRPLLSFPFQKAQTWNQINVRFLATIFRNLLFGRWKCQERKLNWREKEHRFRKKMRNKGRILQLGNKVPYNRPYRLLQHLLVKGVNKNVAFNQN